LSGHCIDFYNLQLITLQASGIGMAADPNLTFYIGRETLISGNIESA
jgi:hypothetical protein